MKPKVLFLTLWDSDFMGLGEYFDASFYNYKMPKEVFYERAKNADLIIEQEFNEGKSIYSHLMASVKVPKAMWFIDNGGIFSAYPNYANSYDYIFMSVDGMRRKLNRPSTHLPLGFFFTLDLMRRIKEGRGKQLSFVGHIDEYVNRKLFFDKFKSDLDARKISYTIKTASWREYANVVQDSYVAFNKSSTNECNYRVFENIGFGGMLLTDYNEECAKIPSLADRAYFYHNYEDIFSQIEKILSIPKAGYEAMIKDNQNWIMNNHLMIHRYLKIAEQAINYKPTK